MAAAVDMGEIDEMVHSSGDNIEGGSVNGSVNGEEPCDYKPDEAEEVEEVEEDEEEEEEEVTEERDVRLTDTPDDSDPDTVDDSDPKTPPTAAVVDDDAVDKPTEESQNVVEQPDLTAVEEVAESSSTDSDSDDDTTPTVPNGIVSPKRPDDPDDDPAENGSGADSGRSTPSSATSKRHKSAESESDIEEIVPEDPLALAGAPPTKRNEPIVVKDTKSLADIASISTPGNKNEPTLVIIDTNSILSGRGPVPVVRKGASSHAVALPPAQGLYPASMRATITPIPAGSKSTSATAAPVVLPTLTDDMYVVEAPSFIVPYVYEKPPVDDLKALLKTAVDKPTKKPEADESATASTLANELRKPSSYFESPLGKFFINIGSSLVQEHVQNDLLKQQKRKRDRESGSNAETLKTISTLLKNLEFTKENNEPFHLEIKKCEYCSFRTESALAMAFHLETPHMKNYVYRCNFCPYEVRSPHDILYHKEVQHGIRGRLERAPAFHQCPNCPFEDNQKGKLSRHLVTCARKFKPERNLEPPVDYEPPAKIPRAPRVKQPHAGGLGSAAAVYQAMARSPQFQMLAKLPGNANTVNPNIGINPLARNRGRPSLGTVGTGKTNARSAGGGMVFKSANVSSGGSVLLPSNYQLSGNQVYQVLGGGADFGCRLTQSGSAAAAAFLPGLTASSITASQQSSSSQPNLVSKTKSSQPSISITPLPRGAPPTVSSSGSSIKPGDSNSKNSFVICEICDGYIKDLEQLRNHMQWIHKVKIHPKMIYNRPPLNCQKCQFRFFTDQGLERHLLGSHGLVTSSMQEAANKSKDSGRCPVCGRVYQWKLLNHVARDHNMTLKPAHLSYKCTVCTATFGMYKQFESHVYSAHSVVAKRAMDKKSSGAGTSITLSKSESLLKPLKINDEITIIPQPAKGSSSSNNGEEASSSNRNNVSQSNGSSDVHEVDEDSAPPTTREKRRKLA